MVTMVPDMISEDVKSNAERRLFDNFKHTNTSQNITILHSLGLAKHRDKVVGEIDFVVLCNRGILVLEVKGGKVEREAGVWYFTNRYNEKNKKNEGPFEQANGNMHSLENALEARLDRNDPIRNCFYANAVIMPDCDFHGDDPSINRDILFDRSNYKGLLDVIEKSFDYWEGIHRSKHGERRFSQLSAEDIKRIEVILRGDFSFIPLMSDIIDQTYESLASLTEEQYDILSGMNDNDRLLVSGCAGSGKTLLAKEEYCRAIAEGKNALFLCYNKSISNFITYCLKKDGVSANVHTLHAYMLALCGKDENIIYDEEYFKETLPNDFMKLESVPQYDLLILDEGQDCFTEKYINCIERFIKGGLDEGKWTIFYDMNQNLFNKDEEPELVLKELKKKAAVYSLTYNCRNTEQIASATTLHTSIKSAKTKISGEKVDFRLYQSLIDEKMQLNQYLKLLFNEGVKSNDIVILSKYRMDNNKNCLSISGHLDYVIKADCNKWECADGEIYFSTISAFKGLESKVVIVIDIDAFEKDQERLINYVGFSRACSKLCLFFDKKTEKQRQKMMGKNFAKMM